MAEILHQLIGSLSDYLQGFVHPVVQDFSHQRYHMWFYLVIALRKRASIHLKKLLLCFPSPVICAFCIFLPRCLHPNPLSERLRNPTVVRSFRRWRGIGGWRNRDVALSPSSPETRGGCFCKTPVKKRCCGQFGLSGSLIWYLERKLKPRPT